MAAAFASAVAESPLTGPGAGGFMLVRPPGGPAVLLDFFVAVPGLGPRGRRLREAELHAYTVPFGDAEQVFHIGPASVAVPGMVQGLVAAWERFGRLPLPGLVAPAVRLARDGVELSAQAGYLHDILAGMLTHTPDAAGVYAPDGRVLGEGDRIRLPQLADTLEELGRTGAAAMAPGGWLARMVVDGLREMGGLVTEDDLAAYRVVERRPLEAEFRGLTMLTNPPPSAGGVLIAAALASLRGGPPAVDDPSHYRAIAAAGEVANALRDDTFATSLHDEDFLERFWGRMAEGGGAGGGLSRGPNGTTHVSAIDADGGMASVSSSNGAGSGVMLPGTGFLLNNMLGEEDLNPGGFGTLPPGLRMTSMMAPTLLLRGGDPAVAIGSAGSNRLRSAILQTLVSIVDGGMGMRDAVRRPRVHHESGGVDVEGGVPADACAALEAAGYRLRRWGGMNLFFGGVSAAGYVDGVLDGAGDPRRGGAAAGVTPAGEVIELSTA